MDIAGYVLRRLEADTTMTDKQKDPIRRIAKRLHWFTDKTPPGITAHTIPSVSGFVNGQRAGYIEALEDVLYTIARTWIDTSGDFENWGDYGAVTARGTGPTRVSVHRFDGDAMRPDAVWKSPAEVPADRESFERALLEGGWRIHGGWQQSGPDWSAEVVRIL